MSENPATAAEVGDWLGVSERTVTELTKRGVLAKLGRRGYDLKATVRAYAEHMRRTLTGRGGEAAAATAAAERARLTRAQAEQAELKNASLRGALLDAGAVEREWSSILGGVRARMLAVPSRAQQRLPHLTAHDVGEIDREIREALVELGNDGGTAN